MGGWILNLGMAGEDAGSAPAAASVQPVYIPPPMWRHIGGPVLSLALAIIGAHLMRWVG